MNAVMSGVCVGGGRSRPPGPPWVSVAQPWGPALLHSLRSLRSICMFTAVWMLITSGWPGGQPCSGPSWALQPRVHRLLPPASWSTAQHWRSRAHLGSQKAAFAQQDVHIQTWPPRQTLSLLRAFSSWAVVAQRLRESFSEQTQN